jgi:methyl-accepting chemotaxis protein
MAVAGQANGMFEFDYTRANKAAAIWLMATKQQTAARSENSQSADSTVTSAFQLSEPSRGIVSEAGHARYATGEVIDIARSVSGQVTSMVAKISDVAKSAIKRK